MTRIIGHRAVGAAETQTGDFIKALEMELEMIEFDIRLCGSGELVVFHGPPGGEGKNIIRNKTLLELEEELGFAPPLFTDVVDICQEKILFDIEIKEADILPHVADVLGDNKDHMITSFLDRVVAEARARGFCSGLILGQYGASPRRRLSEIFPEKRRRACRADLLLPERRIYKISPAKSEFSGAIPWGINSNRDIRQSLADSRISGIITDFPKRALEIQESRIF